jgi:hypothetical protein
MLTDAFRPLFILITSLIIVQHVASLRHDGAETMPRLSIRLTPLAELIDQNITAINVSMVLLKPEARAGQFFLTMPLNMGPTPTARYDGKAIRAWDDAGKLTLSKRDVEGPDSWRSWAPTRDSEGDIHLSFLAPGRVTDQVGPRIDLRVDQGGLIGKGYGFLPYPPGKEDWWVNLEWELQGTSARTSARWSVVEGLRGEAIGLPSDLIGNAAFGVGPLIEWPNEKRGGERLSMYWIGNPPWDMDDLAMKTADIFTEISAYFGDLQSNFTVFVRRVEVGFGGTGGYNTFLLEYSTGTEVQLDLLGLTSLLAHEILHEYPIMADDDNSLSEDDGWYIEGVANYYVPIILGETGTMNKSEMLANMNSLSQGYYTSPVVRANMDYINEHEWESMHFTRVMYNRGFMYLAQVNGLIAAATGGEKSLDDIVKELYRRKVARERCKTPEFLALLGDIVGQDKAVESFEEMWRGDLIVPHGAVFPRYDLELVRRDCFMFDMGFDTNALRSGKVQGLQRGSRADVAGVREGDVIVKALVATEVADWYEKEMEMVVRRDEGDIRLRWWPRSWDKVECWWWQERQQLDEL